MNGIDIASHQWDLDLSKIETDFVIVKATQGNYYTNPYFKKHFEQGLSLGKKMGIYHYAGGKDAITEAKYFLSRIKNYLGKAILCLDWESGDNINYGRNDETWCTTFMDYIKEQTGITMFLYISKGYMSKFPTLLKTYPLWAAQYANYNKVFGYQEHPWGEGTYTCAIRQYTSQMWIDGWRSHLDANKSYITAEQWDAYAKGEKIPTTAKTEAISTSQEDTITTVAKQVLAGKWGNGAARRTALTKAGYNYAEVQAKVNELSGAKTATKTTTATQTSESEDYEAIARDVIAGKYGNGAQRRKLLGDKYPKVQAMVNKLLSGK